MDVSESFIDRHYSEIFRHPDPLDHHLAPETAVPVWAEALNRTTAVAPLLMEAALMRRTLNRLSK
ncbi:hypothetical protein [Ensifer sp. 1H6]|uniref:hypothetical protein n=1 Tax=Ensifer sp. 1H6 TaxID=1911585 RepID=UPI000FE2312E|nr:hypothetical protein [Ensifer sp. 1H6]